MKVKLLGNTKRMYTIKNINKAAHYGAKLIGKKKWIPVMFCMLPWFYLTYLISPTVPLRPAVFPPAAKYVCNMSLHNVYDWSGVKAVVIAVSSKDSFCGGVERQKPYFADSGVIVPSSSFSTVVSIPTVRIGTLFPSCSMEHGNIW